MPIPVVIGILVGLYFAKLGLGSPPKDYYVQVDTGSDILWVNCVGYKSCPKKSGLGSITFCCSWGVVLVCNIVLNLCGYILRLQFGRDSSEPSNNSLEGKAIRCELNDDLHHATTFYVLQNCVNVDRFVEEHKNILTNAGVLDIDRVHRQEFITWFEKKKFSYRQDMHFRLGRRGQLSHGHNLNRIFELDQNSWIHGGMLIFLQVGQPTEGLIHNRNRILGLFFYHVEKLGPVPLSCCSHISCCGSYCKCFGSAPIKSMQNGSAVIQEGLLWD
nr:aspartic proteinase-like protein 2 [Quercus suber]